MKKERIIANIFLFSLLAALPLSYGRMVGPVVLFGEVAGVDIPVFALLASGIVIWKYPELLSLAGRSRLIRLLLIFTAAGGLLVLLQQFQSGWNWRNLFTGVFYFSTPLAGVLLSRELRRSLPCFLVILFLLNAAVVGRELLAGAPPYGLPGNWNWSWSILLLSLPAFAFFLPRSKRFWFCVPAISLLAAAPFLLPGGFPSRAAFLSAAGAGTALAVLFFFHRCPRFRKAGTIAFAVLLTAGGITAYCMIRNGSLAERLPAENRTLLWQGAVELGEAHFLTGAGAGRLKGIYSAFLPEEYFDTLYSASIHPHPHNELLFYFGSFGVFGIFWGVLLAWGGLAGIARRAFEDDRFLLCGWAFCILLLHGQVDVILLTPIAGPLFLLLAGILLAAGLRRTPAGENRYREFGLTVSWGAALLLCALNVLSGVYCRNGKLALLAGDSEDGLRNLKKSVEYLPTPENLYALGTVELFDFQKPEEAFYTFSRIPEELKLPSYLHAAGRMGRALAVAGRLEESLPYFALEQDYFPQSAINTGLWHLVLRQTGRMEEADQMERKWLSLMAKKGFRPEEFRYLLEDQDLDDGPLHRQQFFREREKRDAE